MNVNLKTLVDAVAALQIAKDLEYGATLKGKDWMAVVRAWAELKVAVDHITASQKVEVQA